MLESASQQVPYVDWTVSSLRHDRISVRSLPNLRQHMISGDLDAFGAAHNIGHPVGLLGNATGPRYAVRMARDRIIAVGIADADLQIGWNPEGYAVTRTSSALQVFELGGSQAMEIVARGCAFDANEAGPCSAILFAGVQVSLYRHDDPATIRLHIDRSLAHYFWSWMSAQSVL
jgi:hypothetical protein